MRILVTGGAGFIASHIVDAYISLGHKVAVVDNLTSGRKEFINPKAEFYEADISNRKEVDSIFRKEKPEVLNHHAAQISVRNSVTDPINDAEVNIIGLLNLLEEGRNTGTLKKVIFASSGGVIYGEAKILPTPENYYPYQPLSPYGVAKLASENYLYVYFRNYNLPFIALRYSNVYGPRQNPQGEAGVVAIFSKRLLNREISVINGQGTQTRDYVYIGDVVHANVLALNTDAVGAFNIGTGIETDVNKLFALIKKYTFSKSIAKNGPGKSGEQLRSCLDNKLAGKLLSWQVQTPLVRGLSLTVKYFKSHA